MFEYISEQLYHLNNFSSEHPEAVGLLGAIFILVYLFVPPIIDLFVHLIRLIINRLNNIKNGKAGKKKGS